MNGAHRKVRAVFIVHCNQVVIDLRRSCKPTPMQAGTFVQQGQLKGQL